MKIDLAEECRKSIARNRYLEFIKYCWQMTTPFIVGTHTEIIADRLDKALEDLKRMISTYLLIKVPFRHGKSDLVSRYFPPYVFDKFPDLEIILATYNQPLSNNMSRDARRIMKCDEYQKLSKTRLAADSQAVEQWDIHNHRGKLQAIGIEGGATGKGADILVVDDYLKGRKEAESETVRDSQWEIFAGNLITRLAPVHIVIVLATPWHTDDIIGRIQNRMDPKHEDYEEDFPQFEELKFPAMSDDYEKSYLFPERFPEKWYRTQFAVLGQYQAAGLLQCDPTVRGGNMLKVDHIQYYTKAPNILWVRVWDLASTKDERAKDDPDATSGCKVGITVEDGIDHLWIDDAQTCKEEAIERNEIITSTAESDGKAVWQGVESVAGYKDAYTTLKKILKGISVVHKVDASSDKVVCAGEIEPICEAGNVHMRKAPWNRRVIKQLREFPNGAHDDDVDSISKGYILAKKRYEEQGQFGSQLGKGAV